MSDAVDKLSDLLREAGAVVTFDPERDWTLPCFSCNEGEKPRDLVDVKFDSRIITRPFCEACRTANKPHQIKEREFDHRTQIRLLKQIKKLMDENYELRNKLFNTNV